MKKKDINTAIKEAVKLSHTTLKRSGISIKTRLNHDIPEIHIDQQLIEQVILSLISNAKEAVLDNDKEKIIIIETEARDSDVIIKISDSGKGIPVELINKVFEPFVTFKYGGTGIGLNFCQKVINFHNGIIRAGASSFGGAEFTISLPIELSKNLIKKDLLESGIL